VIAVFDRISAWRDRRACDLRRGVTLGFVPTMGALHDGHLSLVERSRAENHGTLVSVFVNPTQFDDPADLDAYPRTLERDLALLDAAGVDFVLLPRADEMYADGFRYRVSETELSAVLEGVHRPGHFAGMLTVVLKLLNIAAAERAYFGEKDWQQLSLVRGMADAFFLPTTIVACPTVRELNGLALSSRNARLSAPDRERAAMLHRVLTSAATPDAAIKHLTDAGFAVDYVDDRDGRRLAAVRLHGVRLIDNVALASSLGRRGAP
jgi:pantoate--beta-alanine ligase